MNRTKWSGGGAAKRALAACLACLLLLPAGDVFAAEPPEKTEFTLAQRFSPEKLEREEGWNLILVNAENPLPDDFYAALTRLPDGHLVDRRVEGDLTRMLRDCEAAGLHPLICSSYRPRELQARLYQNKVQRCIAAGYSAEAAKKEAARWVAVPGTSEHETGLALDLVSASYQILDEKQEKTPEQRWLMKNSWKYGFILRYPTDKSAVTGIGYEPWHYRYVGEEAAAAMFRSGQCLEEYLASLRQEQTQAPEGGPAAENAP